VTCGPQHPGCCAWPAAQPCVASLQSGCRHQLQLRLLLLLLWPCQLPLPLQQLLLLLQSVLLMLR
jgi:hypothetical protein